MSVHVWSENLIKDLEFKQKLGLKASLVDEITAIVEQAFKKADQNKDGIQIQDDDLIIGPFNSSSGLAASSSCCAEEAQVSLKLFLTSSNINQATQALNHVIQTMNLALVDSVTLAVPQNLVDSISIGKTNSNKDEDEEGQEPVTDPAIEFSTTAMIDLWNSLAKDFVTDRKLIQSLGLCDLDTGVFKKLYSQAELKPSSVQVNLKSCCTVPPDLQTFAKENSIKLHTHSDPIGVLGQELSSRIPTFRDPVSGKVVKICPEWMIRMQSFIKSRGVLADKRYIIRFAEN